MNHAKVLEIQLVNCTWCVLKNVYGGSGRTDLCPTKMQHVLLCITSDELVFAYCSKDLCMVFDRFPFYCPRVES